MHVTHYNHFVGIDNSGLLRSLEQPSSKSTNDNDDVENMSVDMKLSDTDSPSSNGAKVTAGVTSSDTAIQELSKREPTTTVDTPLVRTKTSPPSERKIEDQLRLDRDDMLLLCDLFRTPFEHGPRAVSLLKQAHWLVSNVSVIKDSTNKALAIVDQPAEVREWYEAAVSFHDGYRDVVCMVDKLVAIPNRDLLYEIYTYVNDMRSALGLLNKYIKWNGRCF